MRGEHFVISTASVVIECMQLMIFSENRPKTAREGFPFRWR